VHTRPKGWLRSGIVREIGTNEEALHELAGGAITVPAVLLCSGRGGLMDPSMSYLWRAGQMSLANVWHVRRLKEFVCWAINSN